MTLNLRLPPEQVERRAWRQQALVLLPARQAKTVNLSVYKGTCDSSVACLTLHLQTQFNLADRRSIPTCVMPHVCKDEACAANRY